MLRYPDWVHVVAITDDFKIVMVREYRHAAGKFCLGLPAGAVESTDVGVNEAARRELEEETGYRAEELKLVASLHSDPAHQTNLIHTLITVGGIERHSQKLDAGEEGLTVELVPIADALKSIRDGGIPYAGHVSSIILGLAASGHLDIA